MGLPLTGVMSRIHPLSFIALRRRNDGFCSSLYGFQSRIRISRTFLCTVPLRSRLNYDGRISTRRVLRISVQAVCANLPDVLSNFSSCVADRMATIRSYTEPFNGSELDSFHRYLFRCKCPIGIAFDRSVLLRHFSNIFKNTLANNNNLGCRAGSRSEPLARKLVLRYKGNRGRLRNRSGTLSVLYITAYALARICYWHGIGAG